MQTFVAKHRNVNRDISNPTIRFNGFTDNWKEINFRDVFSFKPTNTLSREALTNEICQIKNIHYGDIHTKYRSRFYITKEAVPYIKNDINLLRVTEESYCKVGDVVIADASEDYQDIGKAIEIIETNNQKILAGLHTFLARPKENTFASGFLGYLMRSNTMRLQIMILAQGTKVLGISTKHLDEIIIKVPTLQEQEKITSFLSSIDDWLEKLTQQKLALEKYKKGMMQKIFSQEVRFKDKDDADFSSWKEFQLNDIADFLKGNGLSKDDISENGINKCILYGELYTKYTEIINEVKSRTNIEKVNSTLSEENDVLIPSSGESAIDIAKAFCVEERGIMLGGDLNIVRFKDKNYGKYFAYYLSSFKKIELARLAQGYSVVHLSANHFKSLKVMLPSLDEQQKIVKFLNLLDKTIRMKGQQIEYIKLWKKGLMQKLFI